jgi:hypothetical protein
MTSGVTVQIFAATLGTYIEIIEIWPTIEGTCAMEQPQQRLLVTGRTSEKIDVIS